MSPSNNTKVLTSKDGTEIYANSAGDPSKPHVLFVHAFAMDSDEYDGFFHDERYTTELFLVRFDMRGHGRSGKPTTIEAYASKRHAEDIETIIQEFGLKNYYQVGWSMGATLIADVVSHITPNPLAGIISLAPLPYLAPDAFAAATPEFGAFLPTLFNPDGAAAFAARIGFVELWVADITKVPFKTQNKWIGSSVRQTPEIASFMFGREQDPKALQEAGRNGLPALLIYGTKDRIGNGPAVVEVLKPNFPKLKVKVLEEIGHSPVYEAPEEVGAAILEFIRSRQG